MGRIDGLTNANVAAMRQAFEVVKKGRKEVPLVEFLQDEVASAILERAGITVKDLRALDRGDGKIGMLTLGDFKKVSGIFKGLKEASFVAVNIHDPTNPRLAAPAWLVIGRRPSKGSLPPDRDVEDSRALPEHVDGMAYSRIGYLSVFRISDKGLALLKEYEKRTPENAFKRIKKALVDRVNKKFGGKSCMNCGGIFDLDKSDIQAIINKASK